MGGTYLKWRVLRSNELSRDPKSQVEFFTLDPCNLAALRGVGGRTPPSAFGDRSRVISASAVTIDSVEGCFMLVEQWPYSRGFDKVRF